MRQGRYFIHRGEYCGHCDFAAPICRKNHPPSLWRAENDPLTEPHHALRAKDPKKTMSQTPDKHRLPDARDRQVAVATFDRNLVVTAGAGTGKTTLLVDRLAHLLLAQSPTAQDHRDRRPDLYQQSRR